MDNRHHDEHAMSTAVPPKTGGKTLYTCPMHADIRQDHPGNCPKCGMHLVPVQDEAVATADAGHHHHEARGHKHVHEAPQLAMAPGPTHHSPGPTAALRPMTATGALGRAEGASAGTIYTCPMHPEIRQAHPGSCPKCGMTLEPLIPEATADDDNAELHDFSRRFWWTLPLTVVTTALAMLGHRLGIMEPAQQSWLELVLSLPVILWAGWPFFARCWQSLIRRSPNMWTLIGIGTGAAFIYSLVATVAPELFPPSFAAHGHHFADPARANAGAEGTIADVCCHQVIAWAGPEDGPTP